MAGLHSRGRLIQIYELLDPETQAVRYIGQSRAAVKRLRWHLWAVTAGRPYRVYRWIRLLTSRGLGPIISILENFPEDDETEWRTGQ